MPLPQHIAILWDTSLSRATADKTAERAFLEKLLAASPNMTVDLFTTTLHSTPFITSAKHFIITNGNAHALFDYLDNLVYDGALRIDDIFAGANAIISLALSPTPADHIDFYILASDGLVTLGEEKFGDAGSPVYTLCSDPKANHALLKKLAQDSGGMYLNLQRTKPADAAAAVLSPKVVMSISGKPEEVAEIYPRGTVPVTPGQRLNFTGKLLVPEATITIATGIPGALKEQQITLKQAAATDTGLISRFWAQQKIADLSTDPDHNSDALLALGREFNLVTPNTSLIVLETLDQYLRYRIVPPKSRPEIYADFAKRIEQEGQDQKRTEEEKITRVLALWQQRLAWYDVKYDYAKDFKWKQDETAAASSSDARSLDRVQEHLTSQAPPPPTTLPNGTPGGTPPATSQPTPTGGAATTVRVPGYINTNTARNPVLISDTPQRNAAAPAEALDSIDEPSSDLSHNLGSGGAGTSGLLADYRAGKNAPSDTNSSAAITIKPWSPDTPYLKALAAVKPDQAYAAYLEQRKTNLTSPAFYLDCGNFLLENNRRDEGIRVLTNIAQLRLESAPLLRVAAYRLLQINEFDLAIDLFEKAQRLRPDEPQSWRDLALAHAARAAATAAGTSRQGNPAALSDYRRALELYNKVIMNHWDRFDEIELIALMEANALWAEAQRTDIHHELQNPLDPRLLKILDLDVRIVMTWDADNTDIDLHVIEPSGEEAYYSHNRTTIGGLISRDFTQGYGPEEYCLRKAPAGTYKIRANYFGSQQQTLQGPVTVQATVITNFARPDEKRQSLTLRLTDRKENQDIGEVTIDQKK